ncbi:hypothetical protein MAR_008313 [Mya arenaria]|uniref:Uncharacterized protein n=1 Tax=Mya arenaria TaxID=6604 RepID=A0ABY7DWC3_MYAAR|nr:hypothetical protein MAR_008313 [Mya arenaria]
MGHQILSVPEAFAWESTKAERYVAKFTLKFKYMYDTLIAYLHTDIDKEVLWAINAADKAPEPDGLLAQFMKTTKDVTLPRKYRDFAMKSGIFLSILLFLLVDYGLCSHDVYCATDNDCHYITQRPVIPTTIASFLYSIVRADGAIKSNVPTILNVGLPIQNAISTIVTAKTDI